MIPGQTITNYGFSNFFVLGPPKAPKERPRVPKVSPRERRGRKSCPKSFQNQRKSVPTSTKMHSRSRGNCALDFLIFFILIPLPHRIDVYVAGHWKVIYFLFSGVVFPHLCCNLLPKARWRLLAEGTGYRVFWGGARTA